MNETQIRRLKRYSKDAQHGGISLVLVAFWEDLAAYYQGNDGNYWAWSGGQRFVNQGPRLRNVRGLTVDGEKINTLPDLRTEEQKEQDREDWGE